MEFLPKDYPQKIFSNIFSFFGRLSSEGFLLELDGRLFKENKIETAHLIGQKFSDTIFWQSSEFTSANLAKAIENANRGTFSKIILEFRLSSETKLTLELFLQPVSASDGKTEQIFFCAQDVTDRENEIKHYKERSEQLLYAAENADIGLWFWKLAEDKIYSTPKCNEIFDIPASHPIDWNEVFNIIYPDDRERVEKELLKSQHTGREYHSEFRAVYADGNINWISIRGKTFLDDDGKPLNMMGVIRKITDKKLAGEELAKVYEREKKARNEAVEANRAKDFFLAVVSHELRSPLNSILGWSKILLTKEVSEETRINALETIEKSARMQAKIIDDLIDSSRVASGKLKLELRPVNVCDILRNIYNIHKPAVEAKNIEFSFISECDDIQVFGDAHRLQQVFSNILSNALKFTESGGKIEIKLINHVEFVEVSIKDNGQGISPEALPIIFQQFSRGDEKTTGGSTGLGLGLSIAKILVEKHNGTIQAKSDGHGTGAEFIVKLPLYLSEETQPDENTDAETDKDQPLSNIKILIVEDNEDSREVLELFLQQCGAKVLSAESAQIAMNLLEAAKNDLPDVIISDLAMPIEDGYSLMKRIRRLPADEGGKVPAMALSAFASKDDKQKAADAGFQKYHTKPFEPDDLIEEIIVLAKDV